MGYSDTYALHSVAMFGYLATWPLVSLGEQMAGHPVDIPGLRREFSQILQVHLPTQRGVTTLQTR